MRSSKRCVLLLCVPMGLAPFGTSKKAGMLGLASAYSLQGAEVPYGAPFETLVYTNFSKMTGIVGNIVLVKFST